MADPRTGQPRIPGSTLSLSNLLASANVDVQCTMHNSGNDALMCLFALQKLLDPENTVVPDVKKRKRNNSGNSLNMLKRNSTSPLIPMYTSPIMPMMQGQTFPGYGMAASGPNAINLTNRSYSGTLGKQTNNNLAPLDEFGQTRRLKPSHQSSTVDRRASAALDGGAKRATAAEGMTTSLQSMTLR
jgi:hypothetical protein